MTTISDKAPKIYDRLHEVFGVDFEKGLIIANGDIIHFCGRYLPPQKIVHEEVHLKQQKEFGDLDKWWELYISNTQFRLEQELEAYRAEVQYIKKNITDRNLSYQLIHDIAVTLASSIYGGIISYNEALKLVKQ